MGKIRGNWEEDMMVLAVNKVRNKEMSIREASTRFNVPRSTLGDRIKALKGGKEVPLKACTSNSGTYHRTFTDEQEADLHNHIKSLDSQLMPLNKNEFLRIVYQFADKLKIDHHFNKKKMMAGKDFYYDFMKRHRDLSLRKAESTSLQRAAGFNKEQVDRFFDKLSDLMGKYSFTPSRMFNADETGVSCVHTNQLKVLSVKGKKQVGKLTSGERGKNVTLLLSINASGDQFIPPLFVFPRVRVDNDLTKDAPVGSVFDGQPSGWITKEGFLKWMQSFVERVNPCEKSPVLLILDGHASHKDLDVILYAKSHHIHMLSLPPHTTHRMQPLDRVVMKPFKNAYNEACSLWMRKYPKLKIGLKDIAGLVNSALARVCRMELCQSAFACTGIYPLNRNVFSDLDFHAPVFEIPQAPLQVPPLSTLTRSSPGPSDLCRPSTSKQPASAEAISSLPPEVEEFTSSPCSQIILDEISPLPSNVSPKFEIRKRRREQSEILTSSPYKNQLEEKRARLGGHQKDTQIKIQKRKPKTVKKALKFVKNVQDEEEEETDCIICGEHFSEDWIQCCVCKGWAHENCANLEGDPLFYKCDNCMIK